MSKLPYDVGIVKALGILSVSFLASIKDALLPPLHKEEIISSSPPSLAAGLPHFATGWLVYKSGCDPHHLRFPRSLHGHYSFNNILIYGDISNNNKSI